MPERAGIAGTAEAAEAAERVRPRDLAEAPPRAVAAPTPATPPSRGAAAQRLAALRELVACRIREFLREPEALFWVFLFPVLLTVVLGLAFREKPPDRI